MQDSKMRFMRLVEGFHEPDRNAVPKFTPNAGLAWKNIDDYWPRGLLHVPTMVSHTRSGSYTYDGVNRPKYSILSYTWGRWQIRGSGCKPSPIGITGVDWDIPSIAETHFTADTFAKVVRQLSRLGETDWAWIDIACIDQLDDEIKMDKVGRQVSIFKNATSPFVWFCRLAINDV